MSQTFEVVCLRFGQKETSCPVLRQGGCCVECGNSRFKLREPLEKEEKNPSKKVEKKEKVKKVKEINLCLLTKFYKYVII